MSKIRCVAAVALTACSVLAAAATFADEIQLRSKCQPRGSIVTLGDVADVVGADKAQASKMAAVELFPSPPPGQQRVLRVRELQDLLSNQGVSLMSHRFSGSNQVVVGGFGESAPTTEARPISASAAKRAERAISDAILKFLSEQAPADDAWQVELKLTDAQARLVPADAQKIAIAGGESPWAGTQKFEVRIDESGRPASFAVAATVSALPRVVVTTRTLGRGDTIRNADVELRRPQPGATAGEVYHALEDVVGMEAGQTVPAGTALQRSLVRSPIMIRRGEVVTVYSRAAGIRIRVTARAREDGALGELVAVESLTDRKAYTARVCGLQEAEVFARAMQSGTAGTQENGSQPAASLARGPGRTSR